MSLRSARSELPLRRALAAQSVRTGFRVYSMTGKGKITENNSRRYLGEG
jgi:hypothetical protein